jgi:lipoprotein-anchoring transpeptidase ErfK/SrfK
MMRLRTGRRRIVAVAVLVTALGVTGAGAAACGKDDGGRWTSPGGGAPEDTAAGMSVTPDDKAADVPVSAEIGVRGGKVTTVTLADAGGKAVAGELRADGTSWVPASPLAYTTQYKVTVEATSDSGKKGKLTASFTTMQRPGNRMEAHVYMSDHATYGQAMPIVVEFKQGGVSGADRAAVERRLFVKSEPPQVGAWHWDSDIQAEYRPQEYWQPGTRLDVRLALGGLPVGKGRYGQTDITIDATIDTVRRSIEVDNATKSLKAIQDDQVVKTVPVSLGRADKPSFSGTMVIMERLDKTVFDSSTYGTPVNSPDGYRTDIQYAERLTWDGQFIHAAPWSVADQGKRNVSHGCVNVSVENGKWIYEWTKIGDPVVVRGTERQLNVGNGFTAWNLSWEEFQAGSALNRASAVPSPSTS